MQELVKITESPGGKQVVSARELHQFMVVEANGGQKGEMFAHWIKRMLDYGFIQGVDYQTYEYDLYGNPIAEISKSDNQEVRVHKREYALTLETAKQIAMIQNNDKGREVRKYFIECERKLKLALPDFNNPAEAARAWATQYEEKQKALEEAKRLQEKVAEDAPKVEYFDKLIDKDLLTNFRDTAKELKVKQATFIKFLLDRGYVYRDQRQKLKPHSSHMDLFEIKEFISDKGFASTQTFINPKGRATFLRLLEI